MNNSSETNWAMIDALTDETIDRSEMPPLDERFFERATWRMPAAYVPVTVHIDPDLLAWFEGRDGLYEPRMLAALRLYAKVHQDIARQTTLAT
ncbi:MAG: hypothetical protein IPL28_20700 [Chloroflexi bacterium]|nr:hypothetical protein [Chloroflexota bacterium]